MSKKPTRKYKALPRFFSRTPGGAEQDACDAELAHVVDVFRFEPDDGEPRDVLVATTTAGELVATSADDLADVPAAIASQVRFHELRVGKLRRVRARSLHLLDVRFADLGPDVPGVNDPVRVHGRIHGPLTAHAFERTNAIDGMLTVTRADILEAFIAGYPRALIYEGEGSVRAPRCFHLLLPGDRADEIAAGHGLVLAYPLLPVDLGLANAANDAIVIELVYSLVAAIERELAVSPSTLPVPSRALVEKLLRAEGYSIDADVATRRRRGVLGMLFPERRVLPPQGTIDDFLDAARRFVRQCEGAPSATTRALASRSSEARSEAPAQQRFVADPRASRPDPLPVPVLTKADARRRRLRHERMWDDLVHGDADPKPSPSGDPPTIAELIAHTARLAEDDVDMD